MEKVSVKGLEFSRLSLGTVQLGLNYGINNADGKPDRELAHKILDSAINNGINILDTAGGYGDSENVIGDWLKTVPNEKRPLIVTKAASLDHSSHKALREDLMAKAEESRRRLGVDCLDVLMLHHFEDYLEDKECVMDTLNELKASGVIRYTGASAYSYHDYNVLANAGFDATQIPVNIFDWAQISNGGIEKLASAGMMVFVRSVYLQGLVFQTPQTLSPKMDYCIEPLKNFHSLCEKYNLTPAEMAMSFVMSLKGIHSLVLGSEKVEQVEENVKLFQNTIRFNDEQMEEIRLIFENVDPRVTNPSMWNK